MRRSLVRLIAMAVQYRIGRWIVTTVLLGFGLLCFLGGILDTQEKADSRLSLVIGGAFFILLGGYILFWTIRIERLRSRNKREMAAQVALVKEMAARGDILPIPSLVKPRKGIPPETLQKVELYALQMSKLPWGDQPTIPEDDVPRVFNETVARVRSVTGDWSQLEEPIDVFLHMPRPYCFIGAAEVMYPLSYARGASFVPVGLQQGLKFIARAQYHEPRNPDALVIRTKLLAGAGVTSWLEFADQTLAILRDVAPDHPRLPDAEAAIHRQRGEFEPAIECLRRLIANPPSAQERLAALNSLGNMLADLKRYDEAVATYDEVLAATPANPWAWHNKSIALRELARYDEALECNEKALSLMDFGAARMVRESILTAQAGKSDDKPSQV